MKTDVIISFRPRWVAGLVAFMGEPDGSEAWLPELWGFQFQPKGDADGAFIVAASSGALAVVDDPDTRLTMIDEPEPDSNIVGLKDGAKPTYRRRQADAREPVNVDFEGTFAAACQSSDVILHDVNGNRVTLDPAPWTTPDLVALNALGVGDPHEMINWHIYPKGFPPDVDEKEGRDWGWTLAGGRAQVHIGSPFARRLQWEAIVEKHEPTPTTEVAFAASHLAKLRHFGSYARLSLGGPGGSTIITFADAPEVTVALMPLKPIGEAAS